MKGIRWKVYGTKRHINSSNSSKVSSQSRDFMKEGFSTVLE